MRTGNLTNLAIALALALCLSSEARAEPSSIVRQEIDYLLEYIGHSGCEFNRNGTWHDAEAARAHVRTKYDFLLGHDRIRTTEDFIDKAATKSSVPFGKAYTVRCDGAAPMPSNQWLSDALARHRMSEP